MAPFSDTLKDMVLLRAAFSLSAAFSAWSAANCCSMLMPVLLLMFVSTFRFLRFGFREWVCFVLRSRECRECRSPWIGAGSRVRTCYLGRWCSASSRLPECFCSEWVRCRATHVGVRCYRQGAWSTVLPYLSSAFPFDTYACLL